MASLVKWLVPGCEYNSYAENTELSSPPDSPKKAVAAKVFAEAASASNHEHSPVRRKTKQRTIERIPELDKAHEDAKKLEWKLSLQTMCDAFKNLEIDHKDELDAGTLHRSPVEFLTIRIARLLNQLHSLKKSEPISEYSSTALLKAKQLAELLTKDVRKLNKKAVLEVLRPYFAEAGLEDNTQLLQKHATELYQELFSCFHSGRSFVSEYRDLQVDVAELRELLNTSPQYLDIDPASRTNAILMQLRQALARPAYALMRCDEGNPIIHFLHTLVLASFSHSETLSAYVLLGKAIYDTAKSQIKRIDSLGDILISAREVAANAGFPEDDPLVNTWVISQTAERVLPEKMASSISKVMDVVGVGFYWLAAGVSVRQTAKAVLNYTKALFFENEKDYRAHYGNLPSALYIEKFTGENDASVTLRVIIGPSPAQGSTVHREFHALLQALENRHFNPVENDPFPYKFLTYTNLQNRFGGAEGRQTNAIMDLIERYPISFDAITLSADPLPNCPVFDESVKQKMLDVLSSDQSFTLENLTAKSNYYFPASSREHWRAIFHTIVEGAYQFVVNNIEIADSKKVAVFCDLVHLSIIRYRESATVAKFMEAGHNNQILASRICAVCVDRGMMVNSELMYLLDRKAQLTAQIDLGRGILAKKRLPLEKRVSQIGVLAHNKQLNSRILQFLDGIHKLATQDMSIRSAGISYPGYLQEQLPNDATPPTKRKLIFENMTEESDQD